MKNILVTGGLGFIGSNFIRLLVKDVSLETIINFDKQTYAGNPENLRDIEDDESYKFIKADICDLEKVSDALKEFQIDAIVNFAAESHVDRSIDGPEPFVQTNVVGTLRLLEAFKAYYNSQNEDRKSSLLFLHVSTDEVYGSLTMDDPAFCENTPFAPNSPYSASKASADHLVRAYHHTFGLPTLTTNCSNNYGPYQFPEKLIPLMILNACEGKNLPIYGDGSNIRDWLHVEDHCKGIFSVLQGGRVGETYCIGGASEKPIWKSLIPFVEFSIANFPNGHRIINLKLLSRTGLAMTIDTQSISQRLKVSWVGSLRIHLKREWSKQFNGISTIKNGAIMFHQVIIKGKDWAGRNE